MSKHLRAKVLLSLALCFCNTMASYALPSQGTLNNTAATINVNNNQMTISGKGNNNIINWATFDVATGETVKFNDKNNYLNLVHGIDMSRIYGTISGGNIVYLVNPNGILFGQGAKLDNIGSFIASTRNISSINQTEFLNNPANTEGVLGSNTNGMDNKVYYPSQSQYVPKITVAEAQLTKVPGSVDAIVLDGPRGVILKNTAALNQITRIYTNKTGGEIGIGTDSGNIALTQAQKDKIKLINGSVTEAYQDNANVLNKYTAIQSIEDLKNVSNSANPKQKNMMLWNDIDASNVTNYNPINTQGTFEGMGYRISYLEIFNKQGSESTGLFGEFSGNIRNLSMEGVHFNNLQGVSRVGGIVGHLNGGVLSNVFASGKIEGEIDFNKRAQIGGLVGIDDTRYTNSEIRNSGSSVFINVTGTGGLSSYPFSVGGIIGYQGNKGGLYNVYNTGNINLDVEQQNVDLGGIVGRIQNPSKYNILGATNTGSLSSRHGSSLFYGQIVDIGGIVGATQYGTVSMGDTYNFGNIYTQNKNNWWGNQPQQIILSTGGTVGKLPEGDNSGVVKTVSVNNKPLDNVYIANSGNAVFNTNFGESKTLSEMAELYDKDMKGIYNTAGIGNGAYSGSSVSGGNDSGTTGGTTGGNDSGTTGGNTGGNGSGTTGGNTGGNAGKTTDDTIGVSTPEVPGVLNEDNDNKTVDGGTSQYITPKIVSDSSEVAIHLQNSNGVITVILNETQPNKKLIVDKQMKNKDDKIVVQIDGARTIPLKDFLYLEKEKLEYQEAARKTIMRDMDNILKSIGVMFEFSSECLEMDEMGVFSELTGVISGFKQWNETVEKYKKGEVGHDAVLRDATNVLDHSAGVTENLIKAYGNLSLTKKNALLSAPGFGEAFGVVSSSLALISSAAAATDGLDSKSLGQKITGLSDVLQGATVLGKKVHTFNLARQGISAIKVDGVHTNADIYCALILSGIEGVAQTFRSVEQYSADGNYTSQELGFTMIDTGFAMLYKISHTLTFGLDDLIIGTVDKALGGDGNSKMSYAEKAAQGFKNLSVILNRELIQKPAIENAKIQAQISGNFSTGGNQGIGGSGVSGR